MLAKSLVLILLLPLVSCVTAEPEEPSLPASEVARLLPDHLKDQKNWADDIVDALARIDRAATPERVCATIAIIAQESGFQVDPIVNNLPKIVRQGLEKKFEKLGPLSDLAVKAILKARAPGMKDNFEKRVAQLKTESDLDRLFRDIEDSLRQRFPGPIVVASAVSKMMGQGWIEDLNPVTTAGSMQVKVDFAKNLDSFENLTNVEVRDLLYTRKGGVIAGTARLLAYDAHYDDIIYRFADYNAGIYSSRNAAFQMMLSDLGKQKLSADGDLLSYEADGKPTGLETNTVKAMLAFAEKNDISDWAVRRAANHEKTLDFEDYDIWEQVRAAWTKKTGKKAPYARLPSVTFHSPKLSGPRSTEWFAKRVKTRYDACRKKAAHS